MTEQPRISAARLSADGQRDSLRARIDAAERRNATRTFADSAREAADTAVQYTRAHPLTVISGALALGLAIGLLTRPGRRLARNVVGSASDAVSGATSSATSGAKSVAARGGTALGTMLGEAAVAYVMTLIDDAVETARAGQDRAEDLGDAAGAQARKLGASAAQVAGTAAEGSRSLARKTRKAASRVVADLTRKTKG
jgi:ElaB/YqjD/DUF883 family membrane-anchored ribosome-binding protein